MKLVPREAHQRVYSVLSSSVDARGSDSAGAPVSISMGAAVDTGAGIMLSARREMGFSMHTNATSSYEMPAIQSDSAPHENVGAK